MIFIFHSAGEGEAFQVSSFTADTNPPSLLSFALDMDEGELYLTFNETVKANTLNRTLITFQHVMNTTLLEVRENVTRLVNDTLDGSGFNSDNNVTNTTNTITTSNITVEVVTGYVYPDDVLHFTLTGMGNHTEDVDATTINITFSKEDLDEIKRIFGLAVSASTTYITFPEDLLVDMNRNNIVSIPTTSAQEAANFIQDTTRPLLEAWDLDMNGGNLTFYFSETMDASSFDVTQVRIQSAENSTVGHTLRGGNHSMEDGLVIYVWLTKEDLDEIKRIEEIATFENDTFVSFAPTLVHDMNFNLVRERPSTAGLMVSDFTSDIILPELISYDLDLNSDMLFLTFSETVDASTINYTSFTLLSAPNTTDPLGLYTLTDGISTILDSTFINLTFVKEDSDEIRRLYNLAISNETIYLALDDSAISDMNANLVSAITEFSPQQVRTFRDDFTPPYLVTFDLDLNTNQLYLTFSETVDLDTFDLEEISLISINNASESTFANVTLTGGSFTMENSTMITLNLTLEDTNSLKRFPELAVSNETTYISFSSALIQDMNANSVTALSCAVAGSCDAIPVTMYTEDLTPPILSAFDLNMTAGLLTLYFTETVNTTSLDVSQITLRNSENSSSSAEPSFTLTPESSSTSTPFNDVVYVDIGLDDLNELKRIRGLATSDDDTFISITNTTVLDMNENSVEAILSSSTIQVANFTRDLVRPMVDAIELDMNTGMLTFNFTETIDILSLDINTLTIQPAFSVTTNESSYTLTSGDPPLFSYSPSNDSHTITIIIGSEDLNAIKRIRATARQQSDSFVSFPPGFISDMAGNQIISSPNGAAMMVTSYLPDVEGPILLAYTLNLTSELLILTFDETVDVSTLNITYVVLQSGVGSGTSGGSGSGQTAAGSGSGSGVGLGVTRYRLTGVRNVTEIDDPVVTILLTDSDLHEIKLRRELASNPNNTFITLRNGTVFDNALQPNPSQPLLAQEVSVYGFDTVSPRLLAFVANVNDGTLILNFDEPVDVSTFNPRGITLQTMEATTRTDQTQTLTGGDTMSEDGLSIVVFLTESDLNDLKRNDTLFTARENAYLTLDPIFIRDIAGNAIAPILDGRALQATRLVNDTSMPVLEAFSLDMDLGHLTLTFSETVNVSSLQFTDITLQRSSSVTFDLYEYTLTRGSLLSERDDTVVFILIDNDDLNQVKIRGIASQANRTWLTFPSSLIEDMNMQEVEERENGINAARVDNYTADTTSPELLSFSLNLTSGTVTLSFSESVDVEETLDVTELTFQNLPRIQIDPDGLNLYTLTFSSFSNSSNGPVIEILLGLEDLNELKARPFLATSENDTYISFGEDFIQDMVSNFVMPIPDTRALKVSQGEVEADTINPTLNHFDLDLTAETLTLSFSETVDLSSLDFAQFRIVDGPNPAVTFALSGGRVMTPTDTDVITVSLLTPDINRLKQLVTLATERNNTYLAISTAALTDTSGLAVVPISLRDPLQVRVFVGDQTPPMLVSFDLDLDGPGSLTLTFNETVNVESLDVAELTLQDDTTASTQYSLETSTTTSINTTVIVIDLSLADSNEIKRLTTLATSRSNAYLSLTSESISDTSNNSVVPISDMSAERVRGYTQDLMRPTLDSFSIDLTSGNVSLRFSETVRSSAFNPRALTLQGTQTAASSNAHILTGGTWDTTVDGPTIELQLSFFDLNTLKQLEGVATSPNNTFLVARPDLVRDMNNNLLVPHLDGQPLAIREEDFVTDQIRPELLSFVVDLDSGALRLNFSEAINVSTFSPEEIVLQDCCYNCDLGGSGSGLMSGNGSGLGSVNGGMGMENGSASGVGTGSGLPGCSVPVYNFTLTGGECDGVEDTYFTCSLSTGDLNEVKRLPLCLFNNNGLDCCLSFVGQPIADQMQNQIDPSAFDDCGYPSTIFIPDQNPVALVDFVGLNLNSRALVLAFNETISAASVNLTRLSLHSFYRDPQYTFTLTGGEVTSLDDTSLTFVLSEEDWFEIQRLRGLCSDIFNCWLSLDEDFVQDTSENSNIVIPREGAVPVSAFIDDTGRPTLQSFELDLNANTATLMFSETVAVSTLDPTAIVFLNNRSDSAIMIGLTGGSTSSMDGRMVVVDLEVADTNRIRALDDIGTSESNTFIAISESLIADTVVKSAPNLVNPIFPASALQVAPGALTPDATPPSIVSFGLDLDLDLIFFTFDEPIRVSSVMYDSFTLQSERSQTPQDSRTLTGGDTTTETNFNGTMSLTVQLLQPDIRYLKLSESLATSIADTRLSVLSGSVLDMAGNELIAIPPLQALPASSFTADDTQASLIAFVLDMNLGLIHLTFDDIINASSFYAPGLSLQNTARTTRTEDMVTLTTSSFTESLDGYFITVNVSTEDLNRVKLNDDLATSEQNAFVSIRAFTFDDNFGRDIVASTIKEGLNVSRFIPDITAPELLEFDFNADLGLIVLTFDETVRANTIVEEELTLLNAENISEAVSYHTLRNGSASRMDSTVITVFITTEDLNRIKELSDLVTDDFDTYLAFGPGLIMDMNGNPVMEVSNMSAIPVSNYSQDLTSPNLVSFTIDLTLEEIVLTFDETVNGSSLNIPEFRVQGVAAALSDDDEFRVLSNSTHSTNFSTIVFIYLGLEDLNEIKRQTSVATSANTTFLSITTNAIADMNSNLVEAIPTSNALEASGFDRDSIPPELTGFSLNLTSDLLTLSFSETVLVSSHSLDQYTLQSSEDAEAASQVYSLTGGLSQPNDYHVVSVELSVADLNEVKRLRELATNNTNTYLTVSAGAITDMSGNFLVAVEDFMGLRVEEFTADFARPSLLTFNLDMNTGIVSLMFSETVMASSLDVTQLTLQDSENISNVTGMHSLSNTSFSDVNDTNFVVIVISPSDLNEIKRLYTLAVDNSTTFISITPSLIRDMNNNFVVEITEDQALPVSVFVPDINRPILEEFDLNLNSSELLLRFNETVNRESLNVESITIQHAQNASDDDVPFSLDLTQSSSSDSPNDTFIVVDIGIFDLNNLKRLTRVAVSNSTSYLSLNYTAIRDMNENAILQISGSNGLRVTNFVQDDIRPTLDGFSLDVNTGVLILTFSETVDAESLDVSSITLQSEEVLLSGEEYRFSDELDSSNMSVSYTNSTDDPILVVIIGALDLNAIKQIFSLANSNDSTYITIDADSVVDMVGLPVESVGPDMALPVNEYIADSVGPELLSFTLNLTSENLILTFDETVNVDSFNITQLILHSNSNISESSYHILQDLRNISMENSTEVTVLLSLDDLHQIKLDTDLATSPDNTHLQVLPSALHDMALEPNYIQPLTISILEEDYAEDAVSPNLVSFAVDMNSGVLTLNFDEPVNASSIDFTGITLLSGRVRLDLEVAGSGSSNATENSTDSTSGDGGESRPSSFTLTGGYSENMNGLQVEVNFTIDDLNAIKQDELLFTNISTSFLRLTSQVIADMNRNRVNAIPETAALQASAFINDTTSPILLSFDLDMDNGVLLLNFSETVDVSTTMFQQIILQRRSNVTTEVNRYMLSGGELTMFEDGLVAEIQISLQDLNELKRRRIAVSRDTTWLTLGNMTILDMNDRLLVALVNGMTARLVRNYVRDETPPELQSFDLDLTREVLTLNFTETVDTFFFNVSSITLQDTAEGLNMFNRYQLTDSSYLSTPDNSVLEVVLGVEDLNAIKQLYELATSMNDTFLSVDSELVTDVFGNSVEEIPVDNAQQVRDYFGDTVQPRLLAFDLDLDQRILTLFFSETVDVSSLEISSFVLAGRTSLPRQEHQLMSSFSPSENDSTIELNITREDFNTIKTLTDLATDESDTYLEFDSVAIADMAGNQLDDRNTPLEVSNYTQDMSSPVLEFFDLDMNGVVLTLEFSETVNVSTINFTAITLVESDVPYFLQYRLLDGGVALVNSPTVEVQLLREDEDNLKRIDNLATSPENTYLEVTSELIEDMDGNPVEDTPTPLPVRNFTEDSTAPFLVDFSLDLDSNILQLTFSETVNISSFDVGRVSLQSEAEFNDNTTQVHTLTDSSLALLIPDPLVVVNLSRFDSDEIRRLPRLAIGLDSTFITIEEAAILDMVGLGVTPINSTSAERAFSFTQDLVNPYLEAFSVDLTSETLHLNFSETVNIATFDVSQLTLHGGPSNTTSSGLHTLTGGEITNTDHSSYITLELTTPDLNEIKFQLELATDISNTYLTFTEALVEDMNSNPVESVSVPRQAVEFVADLVSPQLQGYDLDLTLEILTLTFSETVNVDSLDVTQLSLQPVANATKSLHTLTAASFSESINGTVVMVNISLGDLNRIKQLTSLAVDRDSTFVSATELAVRDMNNNTLVSVPTENALQVTNFTSDQTDPELVSVQLDLDAETLALSFSETVNVSTFNIRGISIQSDFEFVAGRTEVVDLTGYANITMSNGPKVIVQFTQFDLNRLKDRPDLGTSINNTFITIQSQSVLDMNNNPLVEISSMAALQAEEVFDDFTPPMLLSFNIDINQSMITFFFSESVNASSLDPTEVSLHQVGDPSLDPVSSNYTLTGFSDTPVMALQSGTVLVFEISMLDLNAVKSITTLATSDNDTFISITPDFISDQSGNEISIPPSRLSPLNFTADTGCPVLVRFDLDLNAGLVTLLFDEPVNTSTFDPTMAAVLNSAREEYRLTSGDFNVGEYTRQLNLTLSDFDLDLLSANENLAVDMNDTFILLSGDSVQDSAGNYYCNDTLPLPVSELTDDETAPVLLNFTLDLVREVLVLTFSETVRIPLLPSAMTLLAEADISSSSGGDSAESSGNFSGSGMGSGGTMDLALINVVHYRLTDGNSSINYSIMPHIVTFELAQFDLNEIKNRPELATLATNTFLSITSDLTADYNSNSVTSIQPNDPLAVSRFEIDRTPPVLVSFRLDVDSRVLLLSFSEAINFTSFDVSQVTLQGAPTITAQNHHTLSVTSTGRLESLTEISILLSDEDSNAIKAITTLATNQFNTYLSITPDLVRDFFNLAVESISNTSAQGVRPVDGFIADTTPPMLTQFTLNLTSNELILTFDETVDASSLQPMRISLQPDELGGDIVTLSANTTSSFTDSTEITLSLLTVDLYDIKVDSNLATDANNTCVYLEMGAIRDLSMAPNYNDPTTSCEVMFFGDLVQPRLVSFAVDINASTLMLNFDEPIDIDTINETFLTLQSREVFGSRVQSVTLSGGSSETADFLEVVLTISLFDLNIVKQNLALVVDIDSSFLSIETDFIADVNGNGVAEIPPSRALQASMFVGDTTNPVLQGFDLDMNNGYLTLSFSETVDVSTFVFAGITLQRTSVTMMDASHTLSDGMVLRGDAPIVTIEITNDDLNMLKTLDIGRSNSSAYITLANATVFDVSGRPVNPVMSGVNAILVSGYTPDFTPPMLLSFSLDLDAETLTLSFNESVDFATLNTSQISIAAAPNVTDESLFYTLNTSSVSVRQTRKTPNVLISLSDADLNQLKLRAQLATSRNNTYIFFTDTAIADTFGNSVVEIPVENAEMAGSHGQDETSPVLLGFDFDANSGTLALTFSETVNSSSLDTSMITLSSDRSMSQFYTLSGQYSSVSSPFNIIDVVLTNNDHNELKIMDALAVDNTTLYLSLTSASISDMAGNPTRPAAFIPVTDFVPDTTPPSLLNFTIDMDQGELILTFNETVNSSSLIFEYLALISNETFMPIPVNPDSQHQLTGGTVLTSNHPSLTFAFTEEDLNEIKRQDMCTRPLGVLDCFLVYRSDAVRDMSGNGIDGCRQVDT